MSRVMLVDDEEAILKSLKRILRLAPCTFGGKTFTLDVETYTSPQEALAAARRDDYDLFISDYRMPIMDGIEFLKATKEIQPDAARLILSGYADLNALVRAVNEVLKDKAYNAFCAVRPPGHHAQTDRAGGFCLINHVAVGAMHAIAEHRLERVAIIDFDVHRGDGTEEIFKDDSRVLLLGMSQNGLFPFQREMVGGSNPNRVAIDLPAGADSQTLRDLVRREWLPALSAFKPQLILLSAGFDGHRHEALSDTDFHEADFAWLTHRIMQAAGSCRGRVVSVLEGGYSLEPLVKSAAAHIHVLAGMGKPECAVIYDKMLKMEPGVLLPDSLLHLPGSLKNRAEEIRQKFEKLRQKIPLEKDKDS